MSAGFILPSSAVFETAADHLPPARSPLVGSAALSLPASPHCASAAFHMVERDGRKRRCPDCPPACRDCSGRGWRIVTHDGTYPECITCEGLGALVGGRAHG